MNRPKCAVTGKVRYDDQDMAQAAQNSVPHTHPVKPYRCPDCEGWHLGGHHRRRKGDAPHPIQEVVMTEIEELREEGIFLGDGVYARYDAMMGMVGLFTSDGVAITNRVYLDESVLVAFLTFLRSQGMRFS